MCNIIKYKIIKNKPLAQSMYLRGNKTLREQEKVRYPTAPITI